jgi:hypothetical protein
VGGRLTGDASGGPCADYPRVTAQGLPIPIQLTVMLASRGFGSGTGVTSGGPGFVNDLKAQDFSRVNLGGVIFHPGRWPGLC